MDSKTQLTIDLETIRRNLITKYQETMTFKDKEVYQLSIMMDKKIVEYMEKNLQSA